MKKLFFKSNNQDKPAVSLLKIFGIIFTLAIAVFLFFAGTEIERITDASIAKFIGFWILMFIAFFDDLQSTDEFRLFIIIAIAVGAIMCSGYIVGKVIN